MARVKMTNKKILTEAKQLRHHKHIAEPWKHQKSVSVVRSLIRPQAVSIRMNIADKINSGEYNRLEVSFRKALYPILEQVSTSNSEYTNRKVKGLFRSFYYKAFNLGVKTAMGSTAVSQHQMDNEDRRWMETFLRKEFDYWKNFMEDIKNGRGKLDYKRRLNMYVDTLRSAYNSGKVLHAPPNTVYDWVMHPGESCKHCLFLKNNSPYLKSNLPTIPSSGDTQCKSNCNCQLKPRVVSIVEYLKIKKTAKTRDALLRQLRAL